MAPQSTESPPSSVTDVDTTTKSDASTTALTRFNSALPPLHIEPLWTVMNAMVPPLPNPKAAPTAWSYASLRPLLLDSGHLIGAEEAERRVLMLVNPSLTAPHTTDTLYAGLQLILPGETAPAHRHTASALRFIIEGERGFSAVGGKKITMRKGDVILTPSWQWHDHGHEGEGPMIWLDGLDLPMFRAVPVNFAENWSEKRYPSSVHEDDSDMRIPWEVAQAELDGMPGKHATYHYAVEPADARRPLSKTMGAQAERVDGGAGTPPVRESCSFIYHCFKGRGSTTLRLADGSVKELSWEEGDTIAVPAWAERVHRSDVERSYLFAVNDRPLLENLGMYRKE